VRVLVLVILATSCDTWDLPINEKLEFYRSVVAVGSWAELKTLAEDPNAPAILGLAKDVTIPAEETSIIYVTRTLTIISFDGTHTISRGQNNAVAFRLQMFQVNPGGDLTLGGFAGKTLILDGGAIWDEVNPSQNNGIAATRALVNVSNAHLTIHDGVILRNNEGNDTRGGGVFMYATVDGSAKLTMTGGAISRNSALGGRGGGVCLLGEGGSVEMTMTGGLISGNRANNGGGVDASGKNAGGTAALIMTGGAISGNRATASGGVRVHCENTGGTATLTMSGGAISGNTTFNGYGGGVGVYANDGGGTTTLTMRGGVISGNTATNDSNDAYGGGVYVDGSAIFKKEPEGSATTSGVIYGKDEGVNSNTAKDASGNLLPGNGHAVYVSDGTKYRDTTVPEGMKLKSDEPDNWGL
jgi:hypothetical protein